MLNNFCLIGIGFVLGIFISFIGAWVYSICLAAKDEDMDDSLEMR